MKYWFNAVRRIFLVKNTNCFIYSINNIVEDWVAKTVSFQTENINIYLLVNTALLSELKKTFGAEAKLNISADLQSPFSQDPEDTTAGLELRVTISNVKFPEPAL